MVLLNKTFMNPSESSRCWAKITDMKVRNLCVKGGIL